MSTGWLAVFVLASLSSSAGCADSAAAEIRKVTYPPNFSYLKKEDLRGHMGALAVRVVKLGDLLSPSSPANPTLQEDVLLLLKEMEHVASEIKPGDTTTNHPVLEKNINAFRTDVQAARAEAEGNPPSYYLAGTIAGSCRYCHR